MSSRTIKIPGDFTVEQLQNISNSHKEGQNMSKIDQIIIKAVRPYLLNKDRTDLLTLAWEKYPFSARVSNATYDELMRLANLDSSSEASPSV